MADTPASPDASHPAHRPPPKAVLWVLVTIIVGLYVLGFFVGGAWPKLVKDHPLLLICLSNRYRFLLATAPKIDAFPQIVVGVLRNLASDPVYYALGYYYGDLALGYFRRSMGKGDVVIEATERWFHKLETVVVFLTPSPFVCALAGATRMRPRRFWLVNLAGTITMVSLVRIFSSVVEAPLNAFLRFNERNNRWLLIASVAAMALLVANAGFGGKKVETLKGIDSKARAGADD